MKKIFIEPNKNCPLCPRLVDFRDENRVKLPHFHNAPVASFGPLNANLLIVGLAPGIKGANRTARPFTGDFAGELLYPTLLSFNFASGSYNANPNDGIQLVNCRITNAVRCVPPQNKPIGLEMDACRRFLIDEIKMMPKLKILLALGTIAHNSIIKAFKQKQSTFKFKHATTHQLSSDLILIDSYHCSRYNTNTGRLTTQMFHNIFRLIRQELH